MPRNKDIIICSETNGFFTSSEKAMETIFSFICSLRFSDKRFGFPQANNLTFSNHSKLILLLLFLFFEIKAAWYYADSALHRFLWCGKDVFYRLMNDCSNDWRNLSYSITMQLIGKVQHNSEQSSSSRCLIIDDADLSKTCYRMELVGKIFSHVSHTSNLGFKGLFMGYHNSKRAVQPL